MKRFEGLIFKLHDRNIYVYKLMEHFTHHVKPKRVLPNCWGKAKLPQCGLMPIQHIVASIMCRHVKK
jgi:hypothetical protein